MYVHHYGTTGLLGVQVTPIALEVAGSIAKDAFDNRAQIELHTECVEHGPAVDAGNGEGRLVCLKCMSALGGLHGQIYYRVELDCLLVDLDGLEGLRYEHEVCLEGLGMTIRHGSYDKAATSCTKRRRESAGYRTMEVARQGMER